MAKRCIYRWIAAAALSTFVWLVFETGGVSHAERQQQTVSSTVNNGLRTVDVDTPNGRLTLKVPDDIRTGDTISGTLVEKPKGDTPDEREKNRAAMRARVIRLLLDRASEKGGQSPSTPPVTISIPADGSSTKTVQTAPRFGDSTAFQMKVLAPGDLSLGKDLDPGKVDTVSVPIDEKSDTSGKRQYEIPTLAQTGKPVEITGPFDGSSSNSKVNLTPMKGNDPPKEEDDPELVVIAESPRKAIVEIPTEFIGRSRVDVNDNGTLTSGVIRNIAVSLSAPKTNLIRGETTTMTVLVSGLDYLKEDVSMTLDATGVVTMAGGMFQQLVITPSQVGKDGTYKTTRTITGLAPGGWSAHATVIVRK